MRVLVTGCCGFIGFHLCTALINNNISVVGIDNLNDFYDKGLKKSRLKKLYHSLFTFHNSDINQISEIDFKSKKFDLVINLAAQAGVRVKKKQEHLYETTNVIGFKNVCKFCVENGIDKIIYASSSSVYSDKKYEKFNEEKTIIDPKSKYGKSKYQNEIYANLVSKKNELSMIGLRFFSVYGPYGRPDMAYYIFTDAIENNKVINLNNDGLMLRDMTYIDDVIDGVIKSIDFLLNKNTKNNHIFNLGNDDPIQTKKLLSNIAEKLNKKPRIRNKISHNESAFTHSDNSKAKKYLRYNPKTDLSDGLDKFISWYKDYYGKQ